MSHHKKTSTNGRAMRSWLLGCALAVILGTAAAAPDPRDLEDMAKGIRQAGFVCERPLEMKLVGQTERGMPARLMCNNQTLMPRITLSPDGPRAIIRP
jgi:hypothetical protein